MNPRPPILLRVCAPAKYEPFHCLKRSTPCTSQLWTQLTLSLWLTLSVPGSEGKVGHLGLILTVAESSPHALIIESQLANYHIKYRTVAKRHTAQCDSQLHGVTWWVNSSVTTRKTRVPTPLWLWSWKEKMHMTHLKQCLLHSNDHCCSTYASSCDISLCDQSYSTAATWGLGGGAEKHK